MTAMFDLWVDRGIGYECLLSSFVCEHDAAKHHMITRQESPRQDSKHLRREDEDLGLIPGHLSDYYYSRNKEVTPPAFNTHLERNPDIK